MSAVIERRAMLSDAEVLDFYERTCDAVHRYASRLVGGNRVRAEDLVQETYLTLVRQVRAGRTERVDVGWAITTCRSRFLDQIRRSSRMERTDRRNFQRQQPEPTEPRANATDALGRLPDSQRAVLVLRYVDELSVAEVASAMGRSVRATESLLVRARDALRAAYAAEGGDRS